MNNLKVLTLNCQKGYNPRIGDYLTAVLGSNFYDFVLLQEADEKIISTVQGRGDYNLLSSIDPQSHIHSHVCVMYRNNFILNNSIFVPFSSGSDWGFIAGTFNLGKELIIVGSSHLRAGFSFRNRSKQLKQIKEKLLAYNPSKLRTVFGGDFNFGFPWEEHRAGKLLAPEFFGATTSLGPTLNSRYTERSKHLPNRINNFLTTLKINLKFKTDRIFMDKYTAHNYKTLPQILPARVSDHSPVELVISP